MAQVSAVEALAEAEASHFCDGNRWMSRSYLESLDGWPLAAASAYATPSPGAIQLHVSRVAQPI